MMGLVILLQKPLISQQAPTKARLLLTQLDARHLSQVSLGHVILQVQ
jgi:hypothetical protein